LNVGNERANSQPCAVSVVETQLRKIYIQLENARQSLSRSPRGLAVNDSMSGTADKLEIDFAI